MTTTEGSRCISSNIACRMASRNVTGPPFPFVAGDLEESAINYLRAFLAPLFAADTFELLAAVFTDFATTLETALRLAAPASLPAPRAPARVVAFAGLA